MVMINQTHYSIVTLHYLQSYRFYDMEHILLNLSNKAMLVMSRLHDRNPFA